MTTQERQVLNTAIVALNRTTRVVARVLPAGAKQQPDALLEIEKGHHKYRFTAEVKNADRFETPAMVKARFADLRNRPLLVARYITRKIAERCRDLHLPFIDTAGNAYLEAPGLLVYVVGQQRPADVRPDRFRALNAAGLQVTFALLCQPDLILTNHRKIAAAAGVALGTVGPVMRDLETRGFLRFQGPKERKLLQPERILQEWVTHYPTTLRLKLNPRRFQADTERIRLADLKPQNAFWGGEVAAERLTHFLKPEHFMIYAREPVTTLLATNRMRADPNGNVEVLDVFWQFPAATDYPDLVPPVLAYADLLATNDGRNAEAARLIHEQWIEPAFRPAG